jgi:hypothetical protein
MLDMKLAAGEKPLFASTDGSYLDPATRAAGCGRRPDEAGLSTNEIVDRIGNTLAVVERHSRPKRAINLG